ncbi:ABC transporter permease [Streptomyces sp. PvR034]|uniref:ABC transporter permease n=1 Tax=Streptomyces sp. PvR034 TaxID=3156401 RepID=UPI00339847F6
MTGSALTAPRTTSANRTGTVSAVLRLHRASLLIWTAYVVITAGILLWMLGPGGAHAIDEMAQCERSKACDSHPAVGLYKIALLAVQWLILAPSYLLPAYAAALVGRELETGTAGLAWTQNVSPTRWLATKLAVTAAAVTLGMTVLVLLLRTVRDHRFGIGNWSLYDPFVYHDAALLAIAYPLFGLVLGALAGILLGRAMAALATATAVTAVLAYVYSLVRFHFWPSVTLTTPADGPYPRGMILSTELFSSDGTRLSGLELMRRSGPDVHASYAVHEYHPVSHFWPLQAVETGSLLALTALAGLGAFSLLRRRTA